MIKNIQNISFKGIYMIKFPNSYSDEQIKNIHSKIENQTHCNKLNCVNPIFRTNIVPHKPETSTTDIMLLTSLDNPSIIYPLLANINQKLADQYVEKTKMYLEI